MERYLQYNHISLNDSKDTIRGRYIISNRAIPKGSIIITSQPLGTVILPQASKEYCNYCFRKPPQPQRCSQCKHAYFCDMDCFKNAWLSYHQYVCKKATTDTPSPEAPPLLRNAEQDMDSEMLEKVALNVLRYRKRLQQQEPRNTDMRDCGEETVEATMEAFSSLMGHDAFQYDTLRKKRQSLAEEVLKKPYLQQLGIQITADELVQYLNVFTSNNFTIDDNDMFPIGEGTYPIASLFNHSCRPNAVVMFDGAIAAIHAIEDILPNEEITISYVDPAHSRKQRQKALYDKYFFKCQCLRCGDNSYLSMIDEILGDEESDWDRAEDLLRNMEQQHTQPQQTADKRTRILQQVEDWDLLEMCQKYDRKSDGQLDPHQPLNIANYTHYFIQFFAPYLLTWDKPELYQQNATVTSPSNTSFKEELNDFDDPLPSMARPKVPATYDSIIETCAKEILARANSGNGNVDDIEPYRLSTLSICSRLFYDEMAEGHWRNAVKLGMYVLIQYCLIYPPYHPMLAQHFLVLAKACWNSVIQSELINDNLRLDKVYERGVRRWIVSSKETVSVAFGKHSKLWRETLELEWIFLREQKLK